jgi:hypothetical protein
MIYIALLLNLVSCGQPCVIANTNRDRELIVIAHL